MSLSYIIAAVVILFGGFLILHFGRENKALYLLAFFIIASMTRPVTGSLPAWAVELILILYACRFKVIIDKKTGWYLLFIVFAVFSLFYSDYPLRGLHGIAMYVFPLFYYSLAATAIKRIKDVERLFSLIIKSNVLLVIFSVVSLFVLFAFSYYGMAICTIPLFLFFKTKNKKYFIHLLVCLLPALLTVKRTPLLGIAVSVLVFTAILYRWKAVLPSMLALGIGIFLIVSIPAFRSKLFYDGSTMSTQEVYSGGMIEKLNTNGRLQFWSYAWDEFFEQSPYIGVGTGTVKSFMQSEANPYINDFSLMHNDWLLLLCETGLVGVFLLLAFIFHVLRKCIKYSGKQYPMELRLIAATCAGSVAGTVTHMFFENCMNSFVFSTTFVFYAIFNFYMKRYC